MNENPQVANGQISEFLEAISSNDSAKRVSKDHAKRIITRHGITKNKSRKASKVRRKMAKSTKRKARR